MSTLKEICKEQRELLNECRQNIKELTEENEKLKEDFKFTKKMHLGHIKYFSNNNELLRDEVKSLKQENKALRLQSDTYFEQWQQHKALNNEISQHIGNKPSSSTYKYFRGKLNALEIREDE